MASVLPFAHINFVPNGPDRADFSDVALANQPGRPVLDDKNTNAYALMRWLGPLVAEPERNGGRVDYYLRNERNARVSDASCNVVSEKDLDGILKKDFEAIAAKLKTATPKSGNDRDVLKYAIDEMAALQSDARRKERRFYFMKWSDDKKKWHLVWCPGFRRTDPTQPAVPVICTSRCRLYFLNRTPNAARCPECHGATPPPTSGKQTTGFSLGKAIALLLVVAAVVWGAWWFNSNFRDSGSETKLASHALIVSPDTWTGPVDSQVEFTVMQPGQNGQPDVDVTATTRPVVDESRIITFNDPFKLVAQAKSPGRTMITFAVGDLTQQVEITVQPPTNPKELMLEPAKLDVSVDAQVSWKLKGRFADDREIDLTAAAEYAPRVDDPFFIDRGMVRGLEAGEGSLLIRYRATPDSEYMSAELPVVVSEIPFKSLELSVSPADLQVGQLSEIAVTAIADDGTRHTVTGTEKLSLEVLPAANATIEGLRLRALTPGTARLSAKFKGLSADLDVTMLDPVDGDETPSVHPKTLTLRVGEIADVQIVAPADPPYRMVSSVPMQVEVSGRSRLIGRAVGGGDVQIVQGENSVNLEVKVVAANFTALAIDPPRISVPVDDSKPFRVVADSPDGPRAEIAADQLQWITPPRPEIAQLDRQGPRLKGMRQTDEPEELAVKFGDLLAKGQVEVTQSPLQLELSPAGTIELPVGQKLSLKTEAGYGEGRRVIIPAERLDWEVDVIEGLRFGAGNVEAVKAGAGPLRIKAVYQGRTSNVVEVTSIEPSDLTLKLEPQQSSVAAGDVGQLKLTGVGKHGPVQLSLDGVIFESEASDVVEVDPGSGAFRGIVPGKATLTAKHPLFSSPGTCEVTVTEKGLIAFEPISVRLLTNVTPPIRLPIGARFREFRVEASNAAGSSRDVTAEAQLVIEGDPSPAPLAIRTGQIIAQVVGNATLKASYGGMAAAESISIEVIDELEIDEVVITPATLELAAGESAGVRAVGWKEGRNIGDITDRAELVWKSSDPVICQADGSNISGLAVGRSSVTVEFGKIVSKSLEVTIVESPSSSRRLIVSPLSLSMGLDESRHIGSDIMITRDGADVSRQCLVSPVNRNIVDHRPDRDSLAALGPGQTRVRFSLGEESVSFDVAVEPNARAVSGDVRLAVEPANLNLAVGEEASLRVFRVSDSGQRADVTDSALLSSSAEPIVSVSNRGVLGITAGETDIAVRVAGIDTPVIVKAIVAEQPFASLEVIPASFALSVGERRTLTIIGIAESGRKRLGQHPDLRLTTGGSEPAAVKIESGHDLFGAQPGNAAVNCQWRDQPLKQIQVHVTADLLRDLTIEPSQATVVAGETIDFQVFARRGNSVVPLSTDDGVRLRTGNTTIATANRTLRVRGRSPGVTEVLAQAGTLRATASIDVVSPETAADGGTSSSGKAPAARPVGLVFIPSSSRVELGYPGNRIRVIRTLADGTQEDVDHLATLTVRDPQDVISITPGPSGPLVTPKKIGQTQIDAELDGLRTNRPLLVDVVEKFQNTATIRISPNPLVIRNGQVGEFSRVEVIPASGSSPIEFPFQLSATPNRVFSVDQGNTIRATATGQAIAVVTIVDPNGKYDALSSSATVEVPDDAPPANAVLRLTGPSETTVGAEIPFLAELVSGGTAVDLTDAETTLVLRQDQSGMADVRAGCRLVARKPGKLTLQAKYREHVSNSHTLVIRPVSGDFRQLELEIETTPLQTGESRRYKLWGHPRDGIVRQDLTALVSEMAGEPDVPHVSLAVTSPGPGTQVAMHAVPAVIAKQPGQFTLQGSLGSLSSNIVSLDVSGQDPAPAQIKAEPASISLRVGETSAPIQVFARSKGDRAFRTVDAQWESLNASVATFEHGAPSGRITATGTGQVQVRATYGGLSMLIDVKVVGDPFRRIGEGKLVNVGKETFSIELEVQGDRSESEIDYRFVQSEQEDIPWTTSQPAGDGVKVTLTSPPVKFGHRSELYQLKIEAREAKYKLIERYPYSFRIVPGVTRVDQQE